jgi:hypothetical protein
VPRRAVGGVRNRCDVKYSADVLARTVIVRLETILEARLIVRGVARNVATDIRLYLLFPICFLGHIRGHD